MNTSPNLVKKHLEMNQDKPRKAANLQDLLHKQTKKYKICSPNKIYR